jgi:hypothetical protein
LQNLYGISAKELGRDVCNFGKDTLTWQAVSNKNHFAFMSSDAKSTIRDSKYFEFNSFTYSDY